VQVAVLLLPALFCSVVSVVQPLLPLHVWLLLPCVLVVVVVKPFLLPLLLLARAPVAQAASIDNDAASTMGNLSDAIVLSYV